MQTQGHTARDPAVFSQAGKDAGGTGTPPGEVTEAAPRRALERTAVGGRQVADCAAGTCMEPPVPPGVDVTGT